MNESNVQTQVSRTAGYLVLSRRRATALFEQLLDRERRVARLQHRNETLHERLHVESNLLVRALHELAVEKGNEPRHFIRTWLADRRDERRGGETQE